MHSNREPPFRPCWHCTGFDGMAASSAARCSRPGCSRVRASPSAGCVMWARAPGTDDEDWPPLAAGARPPRWTPRDTAAVLPPGPVPRRAASWAHAAIAGPVPDVTGVHTALAKGLDRNTSAAELHAEEQW